MRWYSICSRRSALVAGLLAASVASPVFGDTLILADGSTFPGTLTRADENTITFRHRNGAVRQYSVRDVQAVQFGDSSYGPSSAAPPNLPPPPNAPPPNDRGPGPNDDRDRQAYDQDHMERVIVPAGAEVAVRTNERIDSKDVVEGQTFSAQIAEDVRDNSGFVAIPRGSDARLVTRRVEGNGDLTLDVDSVTVQGRRYHVGTADQELQNRRDNVGANQRTGEFVGGGAIFGAIVGAIAGGGKGAAIGSVAGAGAGAGAQIATRGKEVHVPAETVLRFRLDRPLRLHLSQ
jgi:hypothetical protein